MSWLIPPLNQVYTLNTSIVLGLIMFWYCRKAKYFAFKTMQNLCAVASDAKTGILKFLCTWFQATDEQRFSESQRCGSGMLNGLSVAYCPAWADRDLASKCVFAVLLRDKYFPTKTAFDQLCFSLTDSGSSIACCLLTCVLSVALWSLLNLSVNVPWACKVILNMKHESLQVMASIYAPLKLFLLLN